MTKKPEDENHRNKKVGGARPGAGKRELQDDEKAQRRQITIEPRNIKLYSDIGDGELSRGIRKVAAWVRTLPLNKDVDK